MAAVQRKLVHKQFNSPIGLYSQQNVKETLNRELQAFGSEGIEIDEQISKPLNLANSAVLRAVEEEEQMKCEPLKKCVRESRARQRFRQRPHTPVHQQQLEQIKTQYLSHQHDITIDRDTVLKINRLATRRNLHKRDHSWPPISVTATNTATANELQQLKNADDERNVVQHVRSTSNDNALQFDETVCKRHGIDVIREKFNSPTRIIEPTAQEVRKIRQQRLKQQQQQQHWRSNSGGEKYEGELTVDSRNAKKSKEMINLAKHEELLKQKNIQNKSEITAPPQSDKKSLEKPEKIKEVKCVARNIKEPAEDDLYQTSTLPVAKGFSHPETKAADENIGLVEPKRQFYEQLAGGKKWYSYENLLAAVNAYPTIKPLAQTGHRRQAYSLERGRDKRLHQQLPPQKPRGTPKLQRRSMKLATEIKICYDTDAQQHSIQVMSLNQPKKPVAEDLEHIPLPAIPDKSKTKFISVEQMQDSAEKKSLNEQSFYDDSCIYLRSVDLEDNTIAYIPAAITIVPSPTEEIMQHWMESNNLKANIKDKPQMTSNRVFTSQGQQNDIGIKTSPTTATAATYEKRLPSTTNGIQLTHQTSANTKHDEQISNNISTNNETIPQDKKSTFETDNTQEKDVYYTDGEYLYGPCDPNNGKPLPNATIRSLEAAQLEQKKQKLSQIKKVTETETKSHQQQDKNEIANLTAKYECIQKSINEHLKQIDEYIENAKTALKSTLAKSFGNTSESSSMLPQIQIDQSLDSIKNNLKVQQQENQQPETPLKEILRKITNIMQEVKPLSYHTNIQRETIMASKTNGKEKQQEGEEENMPVVDKVLLDLNLLTTHLTELDKSSFGNNTSTAATTELKPIIEQLRKQATPLELQYENQPIACQPAYVAIEDVAKENKENSLKKAKGQTATQTPPPPPPPPPLPSLRAPKAVLKAKQEKSIPERMVADEQLFATDKKLITVQKQASTALPKSLPVTSPYYDAKKNAFKTTATPKDDNYDDDEVAKNTNFVFDFITQRHQQEKLVEQVIDTLGKLENKWKENLVNTHVQPPTTTPSPTTATKQDVDDEQQQIKSNLNQQTSTSSAAVAGITTDTLSVTASSAVKDVPASLQKCNVNVLANASSKVACNHDNDQKKPSKGNESQLKLCIKDFADKIVDKQFQKYDNQLPTKNTNDVVSSNNTTKHSQEQSNKHVCPYRDDDTASDATKVDDNKIKANKESQQNQLELKEQEKQEKEKIVTELEEGESNHSSGSDLSNTYKSSYELPSPYITERQITWQDVKQTITPTTTTTTTMTTLTHSQSPIPSESKTVTATATATATTMFNNIKPKPKHNIQIVQKFTETPNGLRVYEISPTTNLAMTKTMETKAATTTTTTTTSGHVKMQSMTASKPRIQTRKQQPHHHYHHQQPLKTSHNIVEPHIPLRATSPFGLNAADITPTLKQRSNSPSPSRGRYDIRKYPSPLAEPHLPTRATSPFGLNAVEIKIATRSKSNSPKPGRDDELSTCARKYPARLVEPNVTTRAASPFGLNVVEKAENIHAIEPLPYDDEQQKENKMGSPIRKYPPALIEPHVPTRAASPFGLNAVLADSKRATSSPPAPASARVQQLHCHTQQVTSTASDSTRKMTVVYVPQVEGHNIGLLVRATTPLPYNSYQPDVSQITAPTFTEIISATKTFHDYATMTSTLKDISDNKNGTTNNFIGRDGKEDDNDDQATCDELQRINTIGLNKQGATTVTTTTEDMRQQQQQKTDQKHELTHILHEQCTYSDDGSQQSAMPIDTTIPLSTSIINRSYDNVSPRPYITIEGYKRVAWPPASEERVVREFTPQPQTQYQPVPAYNQQQHQPSQQQQQTAASTQPQQQQHTVSHDQVDQQAYLSQEQRGTSPGIITLRKEAPITQKPAPVYTSQPAAVRFRGGSNMRGDLKWPPPEYKEAAAKENEERRKLALGPVCRPRKVNRDYTAFFAKNALSHHYPSYKVPPGTQHMIN